MKLLKGIILLVGTIFLYGLAIGELINAFSQPFGSITFFHLFAFLVLFIVGFIAFLVLLRSFDDLIYHGRDQYLKKYDLAEDNSIILRHEKEFSGSPTRLISITVDGKEYLTDDCLIFRISSYHKAYAFNHVGAKPILVVYDERTGQWQSYRQK